MCECPGYVGVAAAMENRCDGCGPWRQKYRVPNGQPCTENISKTARRTGAMLCHGCWEAHVPRPPSSARSSRSGRSTPVLSSQLHTPPPPPGIADVCARMEVMLGRMEGILGLLVMQSQAAERGAAGPPLPPGLTPALALPAPPGASAVAAAPPTATAPQSIAPNPPTTRAPQSEAAVKASLGGPGPLLVQAQPAVVAEVIGVSQGTRPTHRATSIPPLTSAPIRRTITICIKR